MSPAQTYAAKTRALTIDRMQREHQFAPPGTMTIEQFQDFADQLDLRGDAGQQGPPWQPTTQEFLDLADAAGITPGGGGAVVAPLVLGDALVIPDDLTYPEEQTLAEFRRDRNGTTRVVIKNAHDGIDTLAGLNVSNGAGAISIFCTGVNGSGVPVAAGLRANYGCVTTDSTLDGLILENTTVGGQIVFVKNHLVVGGFDENDDFYLSGKLTCGGAFTCGAQTPGGGFADYLITGGWPSVGSDGPTGLLLSVGGYRAAQWDGVTLHGGGTELMRVTSGAVAIGPGVNSLYERFGAGDPELTVAAPVGAVFHRTDGGADSSFYVKESGGSTSAGWVAK